MLETSSQLHGARERAKLGKNYLQEAKALATKGNFYKSPNQEVNIR